MLPVAGGLRRRLLPGRLAMAGVLVGPLGPRRSWGPARLRPGPLRREAKPPEAGLPAPVTPNLVGGAPDRGVGGKGEAEVRSEGDGAGEPFLWAICYV